MNAIVFLCFLSFLYIFFWGGGGLECFGHSYAYVACFVFLRDGWIRTQRDAATNLATHLPNLATHLPYLSTHLPYLATHLPNFATYLPEF
jgi:hypothetical protein